MLRIVSLTLVCASLVTSAAAQSRSLSANPELAAYFEAEVAAIEARSDLMQFRSLADWEAAKAGLRRELLDMLGLNPMPERTPLNATVTGTVEHDEFVVENLHFQSSPGLYVTANLYRPKQVAEPLPAVLYVCGHGGVKKDGVSLGNKTHYQHHGEWFARNGYVCLTIDSLQLGEIEAIHHGTYRYGRWWWNARGYTPAGVEAWNCIRALDYLESRPEVDGDRMGVTGRSGGGAYSWWIAAIDERIACAVPVAGITSMRNHVVDGCVEGHCDCMYMVNTYRRDYATVAALVAPRPLLIANTDKDSIFPLDGVVAVHRQVAHIYELYGASENLGLNITEGPHKDTQELQVHAFRWLNRWLKGDAESLVEKNAIRFLEPEQLRVFAELPADELNTRIDEIFVPDAGSLASADPDALPTAAEVRDLLTSKSFAAWPDLPPLEISEAAAAVAATDRTDIVRHNLRFFSQPGVELTLGIVHSSSVQPADIRRVKLLITPDAGQEKLADALRLAADNTDTAVAVFSPRGTGPHAWEGDEKKQIQIRRRFQLIGTTLESMQAWDIRRAAQLCRSFGNGGVAVELQPSAEFAAEAACAALFESARLAPDVPQPEPDQIGIFNLTRAVHLDHLFRLVTAPRAQ